MLRVRLRGPLRCLVLRAATGRGGARSLTAGCAESSPPDLASDIWATERLRSIGIIAHIDAGKTTTCERMIFYAGMTRRLGSVDRGDTVLDYLEEERARGITIGAAAVTFPWRGHTVNLIDTPGHVDFGMEVARTLRVLDGAVAIIDAAAGVQAQTRTVWRQAMQFHIPRLIFVNKMDKVGADFEAALCDIKRKLPGTRPLAIQAPFFRDGSLAAIADLVGRRLLRWRPGCDGAVVESASWEGGSSLLTGKELEGLDLCRTAMLDQLSDLDDKFLMERIDHMAASTSDTELVSSTIRQLTVSNVIAPVLCGAAAKNVGVQPLLDAIADYLPHPGERPPARLSCNGAPHVDLCSDPRGPLACLAFKVVYDECKGLLVYLRIYSGTLTAKTVLFNSSRGAKERITRLAIIFGDRFQDCEEASAGGVVIVIGCKATRTGDSLFAYTSGKAIYTPHAGTFGATREGQGSGQGQAPRSGAKPGTAAFYQLEGVAALEPVYTCAIEADSARDEGRLETALSIIELEDPSVRITTDKESGQRHISGMGHLHLEIVKGRLANNLKAKASFGAIQIAYKETILIAEGEEGSAVRLSQGRESVSFGGRTLAVGIDMVVRSTGEYGRWSPERSIAISAAVGGGGQGAAALGSRAAVIPEGAFGAIREGIACALQEGGPVASFPLVGLSFEVEQIEWSEGLSTVEACKWIPYQMVRSWIKAARGGRLLEPIMSVEVALPAEYMGAILTDIHSHRRGQVVETRSAPAGGSPASQEEGSIEQSLILATIPLASMAEYATHLRSKTGGAASFTMEPLSYALAGATAEEDRSLLRALHIHVEQCEAAHSTEPLHFD